MMMIMIIPPTDKSNACLRKNLGRYADFEVAKLAPGSIKSEYLFFESSFVPALAQRMEVVVDVPL